MSISRPINLPFLIGSMVFLALSLTSCSNKDDAKDAHTIISIDPVSGKEGTVVTITGTGFGSDATGVKVLFNGETSAKITSVSATEISTLVPVGATSGPVSITVGEHTVISPEFRVFGIEIVGFSPTGGKEGTVVIVTGRGFSLVPNENIVKFNSVPAIVTASTKNFITTSVPEGATTGNITVTVESQTQEGSEFHVVLSTIPENFKVAFIGDTGIGSNADAVLSLIKNEGAAAVVHAGDLDYVEDPLVFETNINQVLGRNFPYFYSVGNHDDKVWNSPIGYQKNLEARFKRLGLEWEGQLGVLSSFKYNGVFFVTSAPDELGISHQQAGDYLGNQLAEDTSIWRVAFWHKNQRLMQIGGKSDEAGWGVYEESRKGGAIMATGHEHSYSRTYEMSDFENQIVSSTSDTINLQKDDPSTGSDEGRSFAFVSGLGGIGIRDAKNGLDTNPWWANVYHNNNGGQYGSLFGIFNYNGDATLARFYFKDIDGVERDEFFVRSGL